MEELLDKFKALREKDQIWLLSFLALFQGSPKEAAAFLDDLRKDQEPAS